MKAAKRCAAADMFGLIRAYFQLQRALNRFYLRRARQRRLTPEQEVARTIDRLNYEAKIARRLVWRR